MSAAIRVCVVDDHPMIRSGLRGLVMSDPSLEWIGEAANGEEAVQLCERLQPNVVLMDLQMPIMDGVTATSLIKAANPNVQVIVLSSHLEPDVVGRVMQAGAIGYLLKTASASEIGDAIRAGHAKRRTLAPEATNALIDAAQTAALTPDLTERELEVLEHVVRGRSNAQIADLMRISLPTVKFHVSNTLSKFGVTSRSEAVYLALKLGVVKRP